MLTRTKAEPQTSTGHRVRLLAQRVATVVGSLFVLSVFLIGGRVLGARMIMVSGPSMEPTMHTGDVIFAWPRSHYETGAIVVYRVPQGSPGEGSLVVHRVVRQEGDRLILQGDNNDDIDPWKPTIDDVVGERLILIPKIGRLLSLLRQPAVLASIIAGIATAAALNSVDEPSTEPPRRCNKDREDTTSRRWRDVRSGDGGHNLGFRGAARPVRAMER